jgi:polyisoprenoid-binding protein YceI
MLLPAALLLALLLALLSWSPALAQPQVWQFDRDHSNFYFEVRHIFSSIRGRFHDYSGTFRFDPDDPGRSVFDLKVRTQSIDTHIAKRDNHLRSEEFFHVSEHPVMRFASSAIRHVEGERYEVEGELTIRGVTRTKTFPFRFFGVREHPLQKGAQVAGFEAEFVLDRLEYGVGDGKFYKLGVAGREVTVTVSLEMLRKD